MIERFNFFDVYGYFLPGLALITLIWLPFGAFQHKWPPRDLTSAAAALAFAYIAGHLLQTVAVRVLPSQMKIGKSRRYPSDRFLDAEDRTFSAQFKSDVVSAVKRLFEIDLASDAKTAGSRQEAFFLCRSLLVQKGIADYAEQFQGMYSLMRGLTAAFAAGAFYLIGWSMSSISCPLVLRAWMPVAFFAVAAVIVIAIGIVARSWNQNSQPNIERFIWIPLFVALCAAGAMVGRGSIASSQTFLLSILMAATALFSALRFFGAYRFFAQEFAKVVWRDFLAHAKTASQVSKS